MRTSCEHFFFSSRRRHTRLQGDWSSDVCSSDLAVGQSEPIPWASLRLTQDLVYWMWAVNTYPTPRTDFTKVGCLGSSSILQIGRASCRERGQRSVCGATRE